MHFNEKVYKKDELAIFSASNSMAGLLKKKNREE